MKKGILTIAMIGLLGGLWYAAQSWSSHLEVSKVTVRGLGHVSEEEVVGLAAVPEGMLFREVDLESVRERVSRHPYVKEASVNRDFPSSIRVTVRERTPAALLVVGSRMAVIDEEMVVMPVRHGGELDNLMIISGSFTIPQTGDTLRHRGVERAMQVVRATAEADRLLYNLFSEIRVLNDGGLLAYTADGGVPVMIGGAVTAERLLSFREFWLQEAVPAGADQLQSIDLRYEGQVVVRWKAGMRRY